MKNKSFFYAQNTQTWNNIRILMEMCLEMMCVGGVVVVLKTSVDI